MRKVLCAIALVTPVVVFAQAPADSVSPRAKQLHDRAIVVDSHDDTTQRLIFDKAFDIGKRNRAAADHKIAALMGMEGGHMIDDDLRLLRVYAALGVRYLTLTHYRNNNWADSSTDNAAHNGLTAFGKDVVREMNRLGVMVDISHVADKTFFDAIETTKAPMIASHPRGQHSAGDGSGRATQEPMKASVI